MSTLSVEQLQPPTSTVPPTALGGVVRSGGSLTPMLRGTSETQPPSPDEGSRDRSPSATVNRSPVPRHNEPRRELERVHARPNQRKAVQGTPNDPLRESTDKVRSPPGRANTASMVPARNGRVRSSGEPWLPVLLQTAGVPIEGARRSATPCPLPALRQRHRHRSRGQTDAQRDFRANEGEIRPRNDSSRSLRLSYKREGFNSVSD